MHMNELGYFRRPLYRWSGRRPELVIRQQIKFCSCFDNRQVAVLLVGAAHAQTWLHHAQILPAAALGERLRPRKRIACSQAASTIAHLGKQAYRRRDFPMAAWLMDWLGSVRSLYMCELQSIGKAMWAELSRGFPYPNEAWGTFWLLFGRLPESLADEAMGFLDDSAPFAPIGLEPPSNCSNKWSHRSVKSRQAR